MSNIKIKKVTAMATDPIYIGTGGFTIGRVDNTIVRDPITNIPKIPGSSIAGSWRYYVALELQSSFKDEYKKALSQRADKNIQELFNSSKNWIIEFNDNRYAKIKCAGQDDTSNLALNSYGEDSEKSGHCGHCIVCKAFGFSKKDKSSQGMLFFSDLNILLFPVYTRFGVKWITSPKMLGKDITIDKENILTVNGDEKYLNLGWLNLGVQDKHYLQKDDLKGADLELKDIVVVSDELISQIINSNLEVRTSVSIDPITGTAKEGALFTSEAIPRGTIFSGEIRIFKREGDNSLPKTDLVEDALTDSKQYFGTLGVGGMTTRGFGRLKVELK